MASKRWRRSDWSIGSRVAAPKSPSRAWPCTGSIKMLCAYKSPCITPRRCKCATALATSRAMPSARRGGMRKPLGYTSRVQLCKLGGPARLTWVAGIKGINRPEACAGCSVSRATGVVRLGCSPAAKQAANSSCGNPSLVTSPLNSLSASGCGQPEACTRWMWPEAPSPNKAPKRNAAHGTSGKAVSSGKSQPMALPAKASQDRRGHSVNQTGTALRRLAEMRSSSRRWAACRLSGKAVSRLPASISFCKAGRSPSAVGKWPSALSVRISQRKAGGSAAGGN